jgi:hypothetical protein
MIKASRGIEGQLVEDVPATMLAGENGSVIRSSSHRYFVDIGEEEL